MNKEEIIEYIKHHLAIIIKQENGVWCNANIKLENDNLIVIPDYNILFDN